MKIELDDKVRKVFRDKNGFATEECLDEIGSSLPVILMYESDYTIEAYNVCDEEDYEYYRGEIERNVSYINWLRVNVTE